jgi:hypothetical protein
MPLNIAINILSILLMSDEPERVFSKTRRTVIPNYSDHVRPLYAS